jgi:hypothetical protein
VIRKKTAVKAAPEVRLYRTSLFETARIPSSLEIRHVAAMQLWEAPCIAYVIGNRLNIVDLTRGSSPRLRAQLAAKGISGATSFCRGLVTWGDFGARYHPISDRKRPASFMPIVREPVTAASTAYDRLFLLTSRQLLVFRSDDFTSVGAIPAANMRFMALNGRQVVLGRADLVMKIDAGVSGELRVRGRYKVNDLTNLLDPHLLIHGKRDEVYLETAGKKMIIAALQAREKPRVVFAFRQMPWFVRTVRVGDFLARLSEDKRSISIQRMHSPLRLPNPR